MSDYLPVLPPVAVLLLPVGWCRLTDNALTRSSATPAFDIIAVAVQCLVAIQMQAGFTQSLKICLLPFEQHPISFFEKSSWNNTANNTLTELE